MDEVRRFRASALFNADVRHVEARSSLEKAAPLYSGKVSYAAAPDIFALPTLAHLIHLSPSALLSSLLAANQLPEARKEQYTLRDRVTDRQVASLWHRQKWLLLDFRLEGRHDHEERMNPTVHEP